MAWPRKVIRRGVDRSSAPRRMCSERWAGWNPSIPAGELAIAGSIAPSIVSAGTTAAATTAAVPSAAATAVASAATTAVAATASAATAVATAATTPGATWLARTGLVDGQPTAVVLLVVQGVDGGSRLGVRAPSRRSRSPCSCPCRGRRSPRRSARYRTAKTSAPGRNCSPGRRGFRHTVSYPLYHSPQTRGPDPAIKTRAASEGRPGGPSGWKGERGERTEPEGICDMHSIDFQPFSIIIDRLRFRS